MRSFVRANFAVRLNKGIERKLIFRVLGHLADRFPLPTYKYLGMGSMWFMDFLLADRHLGIKRMVSFEFNQADANRARSNIPLSVIRVRSGEIGAHLRRVKMEKDRSVCWLDFDNPVDDENLDTSTEAAGRMRSGSVLIVTVAAKKPPHTTTLTREQWLRERFLDAVPATLPARYFDDENLNAYPTHLAELLQEMLREALRTSSGDRSYKPLFAFVYRDGRSMVTVGGMVVNPRDAIRLATSAAVKLDYVHSNVTVLEAPLLTAREKALLDTLLPSPRISVRRARRFGVRLPPEMLAAYTRWFREYPLFAEVELR